MLWGGFFFMIIGRVFCIPWGTDPPLIAELGRKSQPHPSRNLYAKWIFPGGATANCINFLNDGSAAFVPPPCFCGRNGSCSR